MNSQKFRIIFNLLCLWAIAFGGIAKDTHGSVGSRFGYTSSSAALGGARTGAGEFTSASAFENPSQLSLQSTRALEFPSQLSPQSTQALEFPSQLSPQSTQALEFPSQLNLQNPQAPGSPSRLSSQTPSPTNNPSVTHPTSPAVTRKRQFHFHWSLLYSTPKFSDIHNVVVENAVNSDLTAGNERFANVDTNYPATFGQNIGFSIQSQKSDRHWGFGAIAYLPLDRLALVDSGESFVPEYTLHRGATQKPEFQFAFSGLLTKTLSFGAGLNLGSKLTSSTTLFLNQGAGTASSLRIAASLKTQATPYFGLTAIPSENVSLGLNYRFASSSPETLNVHATARAIGNVSALDFNFPAVGTMYYEPASVELGGKWRYANAQTLYFELDYQAWSKFESPTLLILNPETETCAPNCGVDFSEGRNLTPKTRDILIGRLGHAWTVKESEIRAGYSYRPGIYSDLPTGAGNAIDPDEHRITAGYGWTFPSFFAFDAPGRIDLHAAYSIYPKKQVTKTPGDENGDASGKKIGYPGYEIGGSELGGGLTLQLFL